MVTPDAEPSRAHALHCHAAALREEEERSSALAELILQIYQRSTALAAARSAGAAPAQATGRTTRSAAAQVFVRMRFALA